MALINSPYFSRLEEAEYYELFARQRLENNYRSLATQTVSWVEETLQKYGKPVEVHHLSKDRSVSAKFQYVGTVHRTDIELDDVAAPRIERHVAILSEPYYDEPNYRIIVDYRTDDGEAAGEGHFEYNLHPDGSIALHEENAFFAPMQDRIEIVEYEFADVYPQDWRDLASSDIERNMALLTGVIVLCQELNDFNQVQLLQ